jgi:hypothetical protein
VSGVFAEVAERRGAEGARRFSRWDPALWDDFCEGPGRRLWRRLRALLKAEAVLDAYLGLAVEAMGLGYVDRAGLDALTGAEAGAAPNLIALFWIEKLPAQLVQPQAGAQIERLARLWNLGEGLLGEASWLNRFATAALHDLESLADVEQALATVLAPALTVRAPAAFGGPFAVTTLDAADLDDRFLPGEMHLAAPAVLCVHDRKRRGVSAGVFLRPGGASSFLAVTPCLGEQAAEVGAPEIEALESRIRIGESRVALPLLKRVHRALVARSGFAVASAVDSQRLWIVESP